MGSGMPFLYQATEVSLGPEVEQLRYRSSPRSSKTSSGGVTTNFGMSGMCRQRVLFKDFFSGGLYLEKVFFRGLYLRKKMGLDFLSFFFQGLYLENLVFEIYIALLDLFLN